MWPGLVGKGPDSEPPIDLDTMLDLTAAANVNGQRFEGVDLFLFDPHVNIDSSDDDLKRLAGAGCDGALVATALHDGRLRSGDIAGARRLGHARLTR